MMISWKKIRMSRAYSIHEVYDKCTSSRFRWPQSMKMYLKYIRMDGVDWIHLACDGSQCGVLYIEVP
jgi:hypothetical protein